MLRITAAKISLIFGSLIVCFLFVEICYRTFDPYPYFGYEEINRTEHGNLSEFDQTLGWKGVPEGRAEFITKNNRIWLKNNSEGFRDIEHSDPNDNRSAIVFLGDSFTWGYEVTFDEMFVSLLRSKISEYKLFNLSHRGYGNDQELITFKKWQYDKPLKWVILMFSENDVKDNNSSFRYDKSKPFYNLIDNELVLSGIPVPKHQKWSDSDRMKFKDESRYLLLYSHFFHDVMYRYPLLRFSFNSNRIWQEPADMFGLELTGRILLDLKHTVEEKNAELLICFIPSKNEIENDSFSYQTKIASLCNKMKIKHFNLAPYFSSIWRRTYYRHGGHWNSHGHMVAANAIFNYLENQ